MRLRAARGRWLIDRANSQRLSSAVFISNSQYGVIGGRPSVWAAVGLLFDYHGAKCETPRYERRSGSPFGGVDAVDGPFGVAAPLLHRITKSARDQVEHWLDFHDTFFLYEIEEIPLCPIQGVVSITPASHIICNQLQKAGK